jgi:crotonobetainyl-CoA:carnitine CoA-transferase CaiB-like acyl-CoA transferase
MAQMAVTGKAAAPMPARISAWAVYDVFQTADGQQIFVGMVSDSQWRAFCTTFGLTQFATDPTLATNKERVAQRERILPPIRALFATHQREELLRKLEEIGLPVSRIARPEDLFEDEQLNAGAGLVDLTLPDGRPVRLPALPVEVDGARYGVRYDLRKAGADSRTILSEIGVAAEEFEALARAGVVA